ncbi:MAG: hypothetical protein JWM44_1535 [Bacilli bacterium]|nr:hypothetical protein [Bacilli bacterium]
MGDCYYHGGYSGHNCSECQEERDTGLEQGTITVSREDLKIKRQAADRENNIAFGLDPDGNPIKKRKEN